MILKGTIYLEIPNLTVQRGDGDEPFSPKETADMLEALVSTAIALHMGARVEAITVESAIICTACHMPIESPELTEEN